MFSFLEGTDGGAGIGEQRSGVWRCFELLCLGDTVKSEESSLRDFDLHVYHLAYFCGFD